MYLQTFSSDFAKLVEDRAFIRFVEKMAGSEQIVCYNVKFHKFNVMSVK